VLVLVIIIAVATATYTIILEGVDESHSQFLAGSSELTFPGVARLQNSAIPAMYAT
jgi:hypothetical protein